MKFDEFKKVKEDAHSVHFRHPMGHEIKLAKSAGLNMGQNPDAAPKMYADTEAVVGSPEDDAPTAQDSSPAPTATPQSGGFNLGTMLSSLFGGSDAQASSAPPTAMPADSSQAQIPVQNTPQNYQLQQPQQQQQQVQPVPTPDVDQMEQNQSDVTSGIQGQAAALGAQGKQEAKAATETANNLQNLKTQAEAQFQETQGEADKAAQDYGQQHIDSSQFEHHGGLGTAIGLILGGIGGALTGQGNPVQAYLQNQQEKWIQSQTINMDKQKNLMSFYTQKFGNVKDAQDMLRMIDNNVMSAKFQAAAGNATDPVQKNIALQKAAEYKNQNIPINQQLTIRRQLLGQMNQQGGQQSSVNPAVASRFLAPDPETNKAALAEVKQQQNINSMNQNAVQSFDRVAQMQTIGNRYGSPIQSSKRIDAEWEPMMDKLTKNNEGRVTPITVDLMSSLKPSMSDDAATVAEKREKLMNLLNSERSTPTLDSIGVNVPKNIGVAKSNSNAMQGYQSARK